MAQKITPPSVIKQINNLIDSGIESGNDPFMIFDIDSAIERVDRYSSDLLKVFEKSTIAYSYKSNHLSRWCQLLCAKGGAAEVCSSDELQLALKDGFKNIFFDGPLKTYKELSLAIENNVIIDIDNIDELLNVRKICEEKKKVAKIKIRLSHYYDDNLSRFGLNRDEFLEIMNDNLLSSKWTIFCGFHLHVGSNMKSPKKICDAILYYKDILREFMPENGMLNLGSGIPADSFSAEVNIQTPKPITFFIAIRNMLLEHIGPTIEGWHFVFEPGRHFVEDFGYLVGRIFSKKERYSVTVAQSNLGINWIPSIRNWHHSFQLLGKDVSKNKTEHIVSGYNCFECDCLFPSIQLSKFIDNPLFVVRGCGAYDMQTCTEWTRRLYPVYTITGEQLDISRVHRNISDFRRYDVSISPSFIKVDEDIELHTPKLTHLLNLFNLVMRNKSYFQRYMDWPKYINEVSDTRSFIEQSSINNQNGSQLVLLIHFKSKICGVVSFNSIDLGNKTATIGYWLGHEFHHNGIVTRCINKLLEQYSRDYLISRFVIKCITSNQPSNNVAIRCGFTYEGTLRKAEILNGVAYDQNIYSKLIL